MSNERVGLSFTQHRYDFSGVLDGVTQPVNFALVAIVIDDTLAALDNHQQHEQRCDGARNRQPAVIAISPSPDEFLELSFRVLHEGLTVRALGHFKQLQRQVAIALRILVQIVLMVVLGAIEVLERQELYGESQLYLGLHTVIDRL